MSTLAKKFKKGKSQRPSIGESKTDTTREDIKERKRKIKEKRKAAVAKLKKIREEKKEEGNCTCTVHPTPPAYPTRAEAGRAKAGGGGSVQDLHARGS